ncbi:MAG: NAD-dependent epimerase/dehydratase family protein [Hyphomonadaceae bacterium]|nr:NAD-dependent epimerase/dehydratase family protein [Hyphomonadaceae bacterium]
MATQCERVLITGGAGFTGAPLAVALRRDGHEVVTLGRPGAGCDIAADLTDGESVVQAVQQAEATAIIHLAAIAFAVDDNLHRLYTTNVSGTAALLKGAVACKDRLKTVILASSGKVYAPPASDDPITEDSPLGPIDHYGISKLAMEHLARMFGGQLPITIVRPFNYTGPGQDKRFFVPKLVEAFVAKRDITVGNLELARDFTDLDTVIEVYKRLVASPRPGGTFNICSGVATPLIEIVNTLAELTRNRINLTVDPALVRASEPPVIVGSAARLERAIGGISRPALSETLARMVAAAA